MPAIPKGIGNIEDLLKRFGEAKELWELWRSLHQEAMDFAAPERETFHFRSPGQRKNRHIFDSTAVDGLVQFSNRIQKSVIPSWMRWMELQAGSNTPKEERDGLKPELESITDEFFSNLNHSNFSTEITPALSDLGIGTGAIMIEEGAFGDDQEIFRFSNVPLAELYPENPYGGRIKTVWRQHKVGAGVLEEVWPGIELTNELKELVKNKPHTKVTIINGIVFNTKSRKYEHLVILEDKKKLLFHQTFNTQRLIVFRWHVTPGEVFGRGPILQMLPDIRTANKIVQFMLENSALQMAGVFTGKDDGYFNPHTVRIAPGTIIPVNSNSSVDPSLAPLPLSGNLSVGELMLEKLQNGIKKALLAEPFGEISDPIRTATEQMLRNNDMLERRGASFGRLKSELVEPLVAAGIDILTERGIVAPVTIDGKDVAIKQTSPLAKAEEQEDFKSSQIWLSSIAQLAQMLGPELGPALLAGAVAIEKLPKYWADKLDVPSDLNRTDAEQKKIGESMMAMAQQQQTQGGGGEPVQ